MADPAELLAAFENRVAKRWRHLRKWAKREGTDAFRVYDRDIPELPYALDAYGPRLLLQQYLRADEAGVIPAEDAIAAVARATERTPADVVMKLRRKVDRRNEQHERAPTTTGRMTEVNESGVRLLVNLEDYLDTGLFLDHRPLRKLVRERAAGRRVLNLFCYTGSITAHAAAGGAGRSVSVDLSNTYLAWARRNLDLNGFPADRHVFERADVREWLRAARVRGDRFDLVVMDPPAYSSSKKMTGVFDVQRDHAALVADATALLPADGEMYFSANLRDFRFDGAPAGWRATDISEATIPEDFRNHRIHRCWRIAAA